MGIELAVESENADLLLGLVRATGVRIEPAPAALSSELDAALAAAVQGPPPSEDVKRAVRDLLRHGGFKPTGRNKPACEYLAQAARAGRFPRINNVVDALNLVSLETGIPISLVDEERALGARPSLVVREGVEGESFVFNVSGQVIDVRGLVSLARKGGTCIANPVKDSLEAKTRESTTRVLAVLYGTTRIWDATRMQAHAVRLAELLRDHAHADAVTVKVRSREP